MLDIVAGAFLWNSACIGNIGCNKEPLCYLWHMNRAYWWISLCVLVKTIFFLLTYQYLEDPFCIKYQPVYANGRI